MSLKKDTYEMAGLRIRHTDNCFDATIALEEKNNNERQRWTD